MSDGLSFHLKIPFRVVIPRYAVEVFDQVRDIENLRRCEELWRLQFVAAKLFDSPLHRVGSFGFLFSTIATGTPLTRNITSARLPLRVPELERPLIGDVIHVAVRIFEIDERDVAMPFLLFVKNGLVAAKPFENFSVAFDCSSVRLHPLNDGLHVVRRDDAGVQPEQGFLEFAIEKHAGFSAAFMKGVGIGNDRPAYVRRVLDERALNRSSFV